MKIELKGVASIAQPGMITPNSVKEKQMLNIAGEQVAKSIYAKGY